MRRLILVLAFLLVGPGQGYAETRPDHIKQVMRNVVTGFVLPGYEHFGQAAKRMDQAAATLCANPSLENLQAARSAFVRTAIAWAGIEVVRFGSVSKDNRHERILFYPDRRGLGLRQTQRALGAREVSVTRVETLRIKSVAVQGLGALEFLLFGKGSDGLAGTDAFRCSYSRAIASNILDLSQAIIEDWNGDDGLIETWTQPGPNNPVLRSPEEAVNEILGTLVHGLEAVKDLRIGVFLKAEPKKDRPRSAIFRRSEITLAMIAENILSVRNLLESSALSTLLAPEDIALVDNVRFELRNAERVARSLDAPVAEILDDETQREKLEYIKKSISFAIRTLDEDVARAAGLSSGFSFSDGD